MNELATRAEAILDITTGELVDPADAPKVAQALSNLREFKDGVVHAAIRACEEALLAEFERQGTKTLRFGKLEARCYGGQETDWDVEALHELLDRGLPHERFGELVKETVSYKVDARVAKQLEAANPDYAEVIRKARSERETPRRVSVR